MQQTSQIADAARATSRCRPASRFATATSATTRRRTCCACARGRRASRWRPCPGSPSTTTGTCTLDAGRRRGVLGPGRFPGNEKAIGRVMNHVARRGADVVDRRPEARPRVGPRQRGGAETAAFPGQAAFFVPIHGEYRQLARHARMATLVCPDATVLMAEDGDVLRFDATGRAGSPTGVAAGPGAHRRHADGRNRRRGAARPPAPGRRRAGRAGRRHQRQTGRARAGAGDHHARAGGRRAARRDAARGAGAAGAGDRRAPRSRNGRTPDCSRSGSASRCSGCSGSGPAAGRSCCRS